MSVQVANLHTPNIYRIVSSHPPSDVDQKSQKTKTIICMYQGSTNVGLEQKLKKANFGTLSQNDICMTHNVLQIDFYFGSSGLNRSNEKKNIKKMCLICDTVEEQFKL